MKIAIVNVVLVSLFFLGCKEQVTREINLETLSLMELSEEHTNIELIKSYQSPGCKENKVNANVYICVIESGDTLFVFEFCKKVPQFAKDDYEFKDDLHLIIDKKDVLSSLENLIYIPAEVQVNSHEKFIVGSITKLEY